MKPAMKSSVLAKVEFYKLFRMSNSVLFFLFLMLFQPNPSTIEKVSRIFGLIEPDLFSAYYAKVCTGALLLMALFGVNSTGKEFREGSYRRSLAMGYTKIDFFLGKIQAISFFAIIILSFTYLRYMLSGLFGPDLPYSFDVFPIPLLSMANKFVALFFAGILGLAFISIVRSTSIGLVFFPLLMFLEIFLQIMTLIDDQMSTYVNFMPGAVGGRLFNASGFDFYAISVVVFYTMVLIGLSYWWLIRKEERN